MTLKRGPRPRLRSAAHLLAGTPVGRLMVGYAAETQAAFEPRSRHPHESDRHRTASWCCGDASSNTRPGVYVGGDTIGWHLTHHHRIAMSE